MSDLLPDKFYVEAKRIEAAQGKEAALRYMQRQTHLHNMRRISDALRVERRIARGFEMSRIDAAFHTLIKTGGASCMVLLVLYGVTDAANVVLCASFAAAFTCLRVIGALCTRGVF